MVQNLVGCYISLLLTYCVLLTKMHTYLLLEVIKETYPDVVVSGVAAWHHQYLVFARPQLAQATFVGGPALRVQV